MIYIFCLNWDNAMFTVSITTESTSYGGTENKLSENWKDEILLLRMKSIMMSVHKTSIKMYVYHSKQTISSLIIVFHAVKVCCLLSKGWHLFVFALFFPRDNAVIRTILYADNWPRFLLLLLPKMN